MKKISLEIYVPASGNMYEMRIPRNLTVAKVNDMIADFLRRRTDISFLPTEETALCSPLSGAPLDDSLFIDDLGLKNGDRLLVI